MNFKVNKKILKPKIPEQKLYSYANLSMARSLLHAKEVAIRKLVGAQKGQLFIQFILEASLVFLPAATALVVIELLMPMNNSMLVTGQFIISVGLIAGNIIIERQLLYIKTKR